MIFQHIFVFLPCRMNVDLIFSELLSIFDAFPGSVANTMVWHALSTAQVQTPPKKERIVFQLYGCFQK